MNTFIFSRTLAFAISAALIAACGGNGSGTTSSGVGGSGGDDTTVSDENLMGKNRYTTEAQWGGDNAPWNDNGIFVLGGREDQRAIGLWATSTDEGQTFSGEMQYGTSAENPNGEGKIGFRAENIGDNTYQTEVQWGGSSAPWNPNGKFIIGSREGQRCVSIEIASSDDGMTFTGQMQYGKSAEYPDGEGKINFRAQYIP